MKRVGSALLGCAAFLGVSPAFAQGVDDFGPYGGLEHHGERVQSPQTVAFEARFGPYRPHIDEDLPGSPYKTIFGTDTRWQGGFEVDWQAIRIRKLLSFGPGFGWAYTHSSAKAPLTSGDGLSAQNTTLGIMPMNLLGVLRFEAIADRTWVPLVPYIKLGLGSALWWSSIGEESTHYNGEAGKGWSYGYVAAIGAMVRLDQLDLVSTANADSNLGINHSSIFIEYFKSNLNGFGSSSTMEVGTSTWVMGLALEI
jgi:hypothetical protein